MPAVGLNLEIDKALQDAAKLDRYLNKWVQDSVTFRENMSQAFNAKAGGDMAQYIQELRGVQSIIKDMSGKDLLSNADPKKMEQMHQAFDKIIASVDILSKAGATLFDTTGLYATTKGLGEATAEYQKLSGTVQKLISDYKTLDSVQGSKVTEKSKKEAQDLLLQRGYSDIQSKTDAELKAIAKGEQTKTELMLKAAVEAEAIAQKELNFAKMTQDEKAKYVQKRMDDILKAEQKNANEIRKQYSDLYRDLRSTVSSLGSYNSVLAEGKTLSAADQNKYQALQDQETKLRTQIEEMELKHLQYISDLRIRFATQDAKAAAEAYKNIQYSPQEALRMAANARTGNAKEQAKAAVQQALMNVDESDVKTIKALNDAYIKLRAGIESLTKAQKNEQTLQPTIRNEYARTLKELSTLEDAMRRLKNTDVYKNKSAAGHADAEAEFKAMEARYKDLEAKKLQLKQQSGALLTEVDRKHESDLAQAKLRTYEDAEKKKQEIAKKYATLSAADAQKAMSQYGNPENVRQAQLAIEKLAEVRDKLNNSDARYKDTVNDLNALMAKHKEYIDEVTRAKQQQSNVTPVTKDEAMNYSRNAKSAKELQDAIKKLEEARGREDLKTKQGRKNYTELTMELERQRKQYQRLSQQVQTSSRGMMNTADQLKRGFAMLFSVQQIRGYIRKMMEVRGEFELQHKSLEVLLQSKDKADELWNKTVALAVRSPFRVKDLVTYTKQLAAYRVESDKLYETNKMLADVSSGLGVDMGRLILAFGQVKAANFLRGTELRQFSEAGVNMLDELAKRFTNLEGRVVTVGEVFERVSKRMVSFKDVEAVFQTITSEGGVFYQMQEKQSETLKGMMMNLKDSVDLMLNDIGQSSEGLLKGAVERVKGFVDNWRHFVTVLQEVGVAILLIKIPAFVKMLGSLGSAAYNAAGSIQKVGLASTVMGTGLNRLTIGVKALSKALFSNPLFWGGAIVSAIAVATHRIIRHNKEVKETNKYYDELSQREVSRLGTLQETNKQVLEYNKKIKESQTALSSLKKGTKEYAQAENDLAVARKSNEELVNQLKRDYPTIAGLIKAQTDGTVDLNTAIEEQNRLLAARIALNEQAKGGFWHQDLKTNVGQAADALSEYRLSLDEVRNKAKAAGVELTNMYNEGRISKEDYTKMTELLASLSKVKDSKEAYSILAQLREFSLDKKLTESANTEYSNIQVFKDGLGEVYKSFNDARKNLQDTETSYASYLVDLYQNLDKMKAGFSEIVRVSKEASPDNWEEVAGKAITKELGQFDIVDSELLAKVQDYIASQVLELPIKWTVQPKEYKEEDLTGWKEVVWAAIKDVNKSLGSELSENKITFPLADMFELPDSEIFKKLTEQVKATAKDVDETIKAKLIPTQVKFTKEQLDAADAAKPLIKVLSDLLAISEKTDKGQMSILNRRISVLREIHEAYNQARKDDLSHDAAIQKVIKDWGDTFKEAFDGSNISLSSLLVDKDKLNQLKGDAKEAGIVFSEEMERSMQEVFESGTYIRKSSSDIIEALKLEEGWKNNAYEDMSGVWTIGGGSTKQPDGTPIKKGDYWSDEEMWKNSQKQIKEHEEALNKVLDKHKDIILTQEQYNVLLKATWQGGGTSVIPMAKEAEKFKKWLEEIDNMPIVKVLMNPDGTIKERKKVGIFDIDIDAIMQEYENLESVYERMALVLKYIGMRAAKTKDTTQSMIDRAGKRSFDFLGEAHISDLLTKASTTIADFDFSTPEGLVKALQGLIPLAKKAGKEAMITLSKEISKVENTIGVKVRLENVEDLKGDISEAFLDYESWKDLKKMDISKDFAEKVFGVTPRSLKKVREDILSSLKLGDDIDILDDDAVLAAVKLQYGEPTEKVIRDFLQNVSKMENKEQEERLKTYVEYAKISIGERAKIKLEELKKLKEIEDTFKEKEGDDEETRQFKKDMAARAKANVKKESQDAMNKLDWENFEKSDTFVRIFEDLEGASVSMLNTSIKKLKEFRKQWQDMPLEDVTKIIKKVQELEDAMIKLKPGKMWTEGRNDFNKAYEEAKEDKNYFTSPKAKEQFEKGGKANFYKAVEEDTVHLEEQKAKAQEQISLLEVALRIKENTATAEEKLLAEETAYAGVLKMNKQQIQSQLDTEKGIVKTADKNLARNADIVNAKKKQNKALKQTGEYMEEAMGLANDLYGAFKELSVALGADEDSPAFIFADMGMSILSSIPNMLALIAQIQAATVAAQGLGTAMNMAMGIIGLIVMAVQIIAQVISAAVNYADQVKQNKIDVMAMQVENLEKAYERLAEAAEKAWSIEMMQKYSNELDKINEKAIAVQQNMVNAMADDKDVQEGIAAQRKLDAGMSLTNSEMKALLSDEYKEYKEAADRVAEMRKEHEEQKQKMLEDIGAVGDYHDATSEFVDAWVSAFQETGDGLSGLQENFREFFDDIIKQQASLRVTDKFLAPLYDNINKALDDYELTTEESAALRAQAEEIAPRLSEALEEIWNQLGGSKGESGSQLSGLQKGIQGVTEETAQVLESLLNSMRFYVADSNNEIKEQTRILRSINSALEDAFSNSPRAISVKMV